MKIEEVKVAYSAMCFVSRFTQKVHVYPKPLNGLIAVTPGMGCAVNVMIANLVSSLLEPGKCYTLYDYRTLVLHHRQALHVNTDKAFRRFVNSWRMPESKT